MLRFVAERLLVPFPSLLVLGGLLLAITPGLPRVEIDPGVIFLIFIPPILYWAALNTSLRDFRQNIRSISLLGIALVLVTMTVVAWVAHILIPEMTWAAAFTFGAIVSPPDAVAVTSIRLKRLDEVAGSGEKSARAVTFLRKKYEHRVHRLEAEDGQGHSAQEATRDASHADDYRQLRLEMIDAEREEVINLRDRDVIGDEALRRIQQELDLEEVLLSSAQPTDDGDPAQDKSADGDDRLSSEKSQ